MKLVFCGNYTNEAQLQTSIPLTAFLIGRKRNDYIDTTLPPFILQIGMCFLFGLIVIMAILLGKGIPGNHIVQSFFLGCLIGLILSPAHELMHAVAYPRGCKVSFWFYPKAGGFFIASTESLSKSRYCLSSLLPTLTLGLFPFALAVIMPAYFSLFLGVSFFAY